MLSLVSIILLLMLSLSSFTQIESATASNSKHQLTATTAADLALRIAMGNLLKYAGPDDRITASATLLDRDPETLDTIEGLQDGTSCWTGVWETDTLLRKNISASSKGSDWTAEMKDGKALAWLVSGGHSPLNFKGEAVMLGTFSEHYRNSGGSGKDWNARLVNVSAPKIAIATPVQNNLGASYAYWIQDASSAASTTYQANGILGSAPSNTKKTLENVTKKQLPQEFPFPIMDDIFDADKDLGHLMQRLNSLNQFALVGKFTAPPIDLFHKTSAVLSNPETGSLQKDLTHFLLNAGDSDEWADGAMWASNDASIPTAPSFRLLQNWPTKGSTTYPVRAGRYGSNGEVLVPPLHPVLARLQLFIQVTPYDVPLTAPVGDEEQSAPKMRLHIYPSVALWNPYDVPIQVEDYAVEIECLIDILVTEIYVQGHGYPTLRGFPGDKDEGAEDNVILPQNLVPLYSSPTLLDGKPFIFRLSRANFEPGECLVFSPEKYEDLNLSAIQGGVLTEANTLTHAPPFNQFNSYQVDTGIALKSSPEADQNKWHLLTESTPGKALIFHRHATIAGQKTKNRRITGRLYQLNGQSGILLQEVRDLIWVEHMDGILPKFEPKWNSAFYEMNSPEPNLPQGKGHIFYLKPGRVVFQNDDASDAHGSKIAPFAESSPWAPRSSRKSNTNEHPTNLSWGGVVADDTQNWFIPDTDSTDTERLRGFTASIYRLTDLPPETSGPGNHYLALHQPTKGEELISLGSFQHLPLSAKNDGPAFVFGSFSKNSGDLPELANRAIWDDFYLTGEKLANSLRPYANDRIILAPQVSTKSSYKADELMKLAPLNINSPYPLAWLATLGGQFGFTIEDISNEAPAQPGIDPDSASPVFHALRPSNLSEADPQPVSKASWSGYRQLIEDKNSDQSQLSSLAESISRSVRSRGPFRSLADFVNSGILQEALDKSELGINTNFMKEMRYTPGYVSQADLLQQLAPALHYRSDTFRIFTYGEARDLKGRISSKVAAEAIVQRLPETLHGFGRPFKILHISYYKPPN